MSPTSKISALPRAAERPLALSASFFALLMAGLVHLCTTSLLPILGRDEPRYVQISREMLYSGDWITPHLGGFVWFEKPVLLYWMVAASFGVFGVSEWAARLGPSLCGLGTIALIAALLRPYSSQWAKWGAFALASSGGILVFAHGATFDIVLTFCLTLALTSWWKAQSEPRQTLPLVLFWVGVGLAFLAKGLVAFVLPLGTIGFYALLRREKVRVGWLWGLPLSLLVASVWYGPVIAVNGGRFLNEFFVQHHFERFTSDKFKHHQPFWYYLEILPLLALPWAPFLVMALAKIRLGALRADTPEARLKAFALAWMVLPIAFFSLSGSKLPGYILPALPAAFIFVGAELETWAQSARKRASAGIIGGAMLVGVIVLTTVPWGVKRLGRNSVRELVTVAHRQRLYGLRVASFRTTIRSAQFYAAEHLLYGRDGEPLQLETPAQVGTLVQTEPLLLLVRSKDAASLRDPSLKVEPVAWDGDILLVMVSSNSRSRPSTRTVTGVVTEIGSGAHFKP